MGVKVNKTPAQQSPMEKEVIDELDDLDLEEDAEGKLFFLFTEFALIKFELQVVTRSEASIFRLPVSLTARQTPKDLA